MHKDDLEDYLRRCIQDEPAECVAACPLHVDARTFVIQVAAGAWDDAWATLRKTMPMTQILARICDHPCEQRCKRGEAGEAIRIGLLERFCVQMPEPQTRSVPVPVQKQRVAVVGSGLSSLVVAWGLARKGYPVVVIEPGDELGGLLRDFPPHLLPPEAIEREVQNLSRLKVDFVMGQSPDLEDLCNSFDGVYWGLDVAGSRPEALEWDEQGNPVRNALTLATGRAKVFVGGRASPGGEVSPVNWALEGNMAVKSLDRMLQGASLEAGRVAEGLHSTRLYVNMAGIEPLAAVTAADQLRGYTAEEAVTEARRCLRCECLECVKVCAYLEHFGSYPRRYARQVSNNALVKGSRGANLLVNSCTLCGLCTEVCPEDFSMKRLCLDERQRLVGEGRMPPSAHEFALEDYKWSHGSAFALARAAPDSASTTHVFFPGCQLSGSNPEQVMAAYAHLRASLAGGVGLMLDCCGAPVRWAGREDLHRQGLEDLRARWQELGRPALIVACPTCQLLLGEGIPEAPCLSLWEVLEEVGLPEQNGVGVSPPGRAVHDPCTARYATDLQASVRRLLARLGQPSTELALSGALTECCGYGGLQLIANPGLAATVAARRSEESAAEYVTYCAMCRDTLAGAGKRVLHVLDLIFPTDPDPAGRPNPGWSDRRDGRARLCRQVLRELGEGQDAKGRAVDEHPGAPMELHISAEVKQRLDARRILHDDVRMVIEHAERTGEKFCLPSSGRFLASLRPRMAAFWVEYSLGENGVFEVHNAYSHRMTAEGGGP